METIKTNNTLRDLLDLEDQLKKLNPTSDLVATIKASNYQELMDSAQSLKLHVYSPFELKKELDSYCFIYQIPGKNIQIRVVDPRNFRMEKNLVEI
ncbi:MAG: hypothetical protein M3R27_08955 [Bacteroidota bacterium]|nr:hypothetical protein [Bacteroidota bacterium]